MEDEDSTIPRNLSRCNYVTTLHINNIHLDNSFFGVAPATVSWVWDILPQIIAPCLEALHFGFVGPSEMEQLDYFNWEDVQDLLDSEQFPNLKSVHLDFSSPSEDAEESIREDRWPKLEARGLLHFGIYHE